MTPTIQERIEKLLDQLENPHLTEVEIQKIERKIATLKKLEG